MKLKHLFASALMLSLSIPALSHEGGHGPKISDQPLEGGLRVVPVIDKKDDKAGTEAKLVYKSELVANSDGTLALYVYDANLKPISLDKFGKTAVVEIGPMRKTAKWKTEKFNLELKGKYFAGKVPMIKHKPYFMDITLSEGDRQLLTAYENLDWSPKK